MATKRSIREHTDMQLKEPGQYHVIMLNDDFTTMDFVVEVLVDIFHRDPVSAQSLMMTVHKAGKAVVGTYSYDIALTKINAAMSRARAEGFPFRMTMEEA